MMVGEVSYYVSYQISTEGTLRVPKSLNHNVSSGQYRWLHRYRLGVMTWITRY